MIDSFHLCLTGAKSRAHLTYVAAYVHDLLAQHPAGCVRVSVIEAPAFMAAPAVTAETVRDALGADDRITVEAGLPQWKFDPASTAQYVSVGAPGMKSWVRLKRANPRRRFDVIVTDEGIGTYGDVAQRAAAMQRQHVKPWVAWPKALLIAAAARALTTTRWATYLPSGADWEVNPAIAAEFRRGLTSGAGARQAAAGHPAPHNRAVIVTQPFADMGLIDAATQVAYVQTLAEAAVRAGLVPAVRPHPAEEPSRYELVSVNGQPIEVLSGVGTLELDPQIVDARVVLGGPSTGLVNVSALFNTPVVWVSVPGLEYLDTEVSKAQAGIFRSYLGEPVATQDVHSELLGRHLVDTHE